MTARIDFQTEPARYRHWKLAFDGEVAELIMDVDENAGLFDGYQLKLNSYDLGVDIELADAVQRLRFEHPEVKVVIIRSGKDRVFCAGANIRMLAGSTHAHKVNFCKFTNETRNGIEDASQNSGQTYMCVVRGSAAGGGYELALAAEHIVMADDGNSTVSLPELPLLAVLPGTGGLTRVTDKRKVRRDLADVFCTLEEGIKGKRAVDWRLVDEVVPTSKLAAHVAARAKGLVARSDRPSGETGIMLEPLQRIIGPDKIDYSCVSVALDRERRIANVTLKTAPHGLPEGSLETALRQGCLFYPLVLARELDDAILHLRSNEPAIGLIVFRTVGPPGSVLASDRVLIEHKDHWFIREIRLYWKRVLKRLDLTAKTLVGLVEPGSCYVGTLAEILFACDRTAMLDAESEDGPPMIYLNELNLGVYPMSNGLSRLATRFLGDPGALGGIEDAVEQARIGNVRAAVFEPAQAAKAGLVTFVYDDIDWSDEIRIMLEERASFSADALTGMEANLRFAGPETMETKIFGRLTAWQNWIFQRPNAAGAEGALKRYGTGVKANFNPERV